MFEPASERVPPQFSDPKRYFAALGIAAKDIRSKTEADVQILLKTRYRGLVKQHYPAADHGDFAATELMKQINVAYGILKDPQKRAEYLAFAD